MRPRSAARWIAGATVVALVGLSAAASSGQTLTVPAGAWEGIATFAGTLIRDGTRNDGTDFHTVRAVGPSNIEFTANVAPNGAILDGTMMVDITWHTDDTGTTPTSGEQYHVTSDHREQGTLALSGTVDELVAEGTLTSTTDIYDSDGNYLEGASGTRDGEVSWTFTGTSGVCALISGTLEMVSGRSLVASTAIPNDGVEYTNSLSMTYHAWPAASSGVADLTTAVADLVEVVQETLSLEDPSPTELAIVVVALETVRNSAAKLDDCSLNGALLTDTGDDVLAVLMNQIIAKALAISDQYTAQELIEFLNIGVRSGAVAASGGVDGASEVYQGFEDALVDALGQAIAASDGATILDIAVAAGQYGFTGLHDAAVQAYAEFG